MNNEKFRVVIRFLPGIPDNIDELFLVECAHFPAERFNVRAVGTFPGCLISLPRAEEAEFMRRFEETKRNMIVEQRKGAVAKGQKGDKSQ